MMKFTRLLSPAAALLAVGVLGHPANAVEVGDAAPDIKAKTDAGEEWNSADHYEDKTVVFFFFPAAMTGG